MSTPAKLAKTDCKNNHLSLDEQEGTICLCVLVYDYISFVSIVENVALAKCV